MSVTGESPEADGGRDLTGYGLVAGCFVLVGFSGALVSWADAPSTVLLFMRLVVAAIALALVFWRRKPFAVMRRRDLWPKLLLIGPLDGGCLLCYFLSIRLTGVAVAVFVRSSAFGSAAV